MLFLESAVFKINFSKNFSMTINRVSNSLDLENRSKVLHAFFLVLCFSFSKLTFRKIISGI